MKCVELHHDYRLEIKNLNTKIEGLNSELKKYKNNPIFDTLKNIPETEIGSIQRKIQTHLNGLGSKVFTAV